MIQAWTPFCKQSLCGYPKHLGLFTRASERPAKKLKCLALETVQFNS